MKKILFCIILLAAFLRLYQLTEIPPGLYSDEAMNGNNALQALTERHWQVFYTDNNGREGLFINIQSFFIAILGNQPWVLRLPSALVGILTVLGIYYLTKSLFEKNKVDANTIALLAAFFLATSFWHINFSRIGFRAITAPFFLVWGIYFLLQSFNKEKMWFAILGGIAYGLGFHSYIAYRATPLLIIFLGWWYWHTQPEKRLSLIKKLGVFIVFASIIFLPLVFYFFQNPADFMGRTRQVSIFSSPTPIKDLSWNIVKTLGMFNIAGDFNWRHNIAGRPELFWPVGIFFFVGIFSSLTYIIKNQKWFSPELFLALWLGITALPVVISNEGIPHALRAIIMIPPIFIFAAIGAEKLHGILLKNLTPVWHKASLVLFFSLFIFEAYYAYFVLWAGNPNTQNAFNADHFEISQMLNQLPINQPKYVVVDTGAQEFWQTFLPSQTIMFLTNTMTSEKQKQKNLFYILPRDISSVPVGSYIATIK
ncbi:MAG TPA: glycosyltransferase family 39 protein [Candidatus Paceibacterota bacterium]